MGFLDCNDHHDYAETVLNAEDAIFGTALYAKAATETGLTRDARTPASRAPATLNAPFSQTSTAPLWLSSIPILSS